MSAGRLLMLGGGLCWFLLALVGNKLGSFSLAWLGAALIVWGVALDGAVLPWTRRNP